LERSERVRVGEHTASGLDLVERHCLRDVIGQTSRLGSGLGALFGAGTANRLDRLIRVTSQRADLLTYFLARTRRGASTLGRLDLLVKVLLQALGQSNRAASMAFINVSTTIRFQIGSRWATNALLSIWPHSLSCTVTPCISWMSWS